MVAALQRWVVLTLALMAVSWAAWWSSRGHALVGLLGALALVLVHALVLAVEFLVVPSMNRADPAPQPGLRELASAWLNETRLGLQVFAWDQPFRSLVHPDHLDGDLQGRRGVLLVHGFLCNRGFWNAWMPRLRARGVPFIAPSLEPAFGDIDSYVPAIDDAVRRLRAATGMAPMIVAHSMGGLAVRAWLGQASASDVHAVITLGTPHHGTAFGHRGPMANVSQMRRGNAWLGTLAAAESADVRRRFVCFYSHCDNIVLPASTATLEGADNRHLRATAHVQLVEHPAVFAAVVETLER